MTDHRYEGRGRHMARYFQSLSAAGDCQSDQARLRELRTLLDRSRLGRTQHAPSLGVHDGLWPPARIEQPGAVPASSIWSLGWKHRMGLIPWVPSGPARAQGCRGLRRLDYAGAAVPPTICGISSPATSVSLMLRPLK